MHVKEQKIEELMHEQQISKQKIQTEQDTTRMCSKYTQEIEELKMTTISKLEHDKMIMQVRGQCGLDCSTDSALVGNLKDALSGRDMRIQ